MAVVKTTLAAVVASFFGKSEKVISEKLSTEEFNDFAADAQEAAEKIQTLEHEKTTAEETISGLTTRAETAENALSEKENRITELEGKLTTTEQERDQYKGWFEDKKAAGKNLPAEDASNRAETPEGLTDYNADALAAFREAKGGVKN